MVRDLAGQGIVVEGLAHDPGHVSKLNQFGERTTDRKAREGLPLALAGLDPLAVVADAPGNGPGRFLDLRLVLGQEFRTRVPGIG